MINSAYPFSSFVVEGAGNVNGARHVFDSKRSTYVPARDLVSNTGRCNKYKILLHTLILLT